MIASLTVAVLGALAAVRVGALPGDVSAQARAQAQAPISLADPIAGQPRLRFDKTGTFKIVSFHDLHYGEAEDTLWGPEQDVKSTIAMQKLLDYEKPDFVVFNGDLITGENTFKENSTKYLDEVLAPTVKRNIPFATTYGNHDNDVNITHTALLARERMHYPKLSYTHTTGGSTSNGPGTFYIPVFPASSKPGKPGRPKDDNNEKPAFLIWCFDSRAGKAYSTGSALEDWVAPKAVEWTARTAAAMRTQWGGVLPPSLAFVHIPTNVSLVLQETVVGPQHGDYGHGKKAKFPGLNEDVPLASQDAEGYYNDEYTGADQPFIRVLRDVLGRKGHDGPKDSAVLVGPGGKPAGGSGHGHDAPSHANEDGGLFAVVSGHDHGDAWCAKGPDAWDITVCFGKHTGYGGYGNWARGARVFDVKLGSSKLPTWIRMEDGSVTDRVELGEGFGQ